MGKRYYVVYVTGNSVWCPDGSLEAAVLLYGVLGAFSVERAYCINSINRTPRGATPERQGGPHLVDGKGSRAEWTHAAYVRTFHLRRAVG